MLLVVLVAKKGVEQIAHGLRYRDELRAALFPL